MNNLQIAQQNGKFSILFFERDVPVILAITTNVNEIPQEILKLLVAQDVQIVHVRSSV